MSAISIVGAGPGALDLMTIRAQERIKKADVLVWTDSLIPIQITNLVKDNCDITARINIKNSIESLNVSVALGISLYEMNRS